MIEAASPVLAPLAAPVATDTVVIGAGQAGLAAAYYLKQAHTDFRVLDAGPTAGAAWAGRYD